MEWIPEKEEDQEESGEAEETDYSEAERVEEEMPQFFDGSWESYVQGKEKITVQAGTWECDRVMVLESYDYTAYDEDGKEVEASGSYRYEWWINEKVPGKLVQYRWEDRDDTNGESTVMNGELVSYSDGYSTELSSY